MKFLTVLGLIIVFIVVVTAVVLFEAWILMLLLGALAAMTGWSCAIGFGPCIVICLIFSLLCGGGSRASRD